MDRSCEKLCPPERIDECGRPSGSTGPVSRDDRRKDGVKPMLLFKSPSYVSGADDSGFYDSYVHTDADDSDLSLLRKTEVQGSRPTSTCSTPNRDAFSEQLFPLMEDLGTSPITSSTMYPFAFRKTKWPEQSLSHTASRDLFTSPPTKKVFSKSFDNSGNSATAFVNSTNSQAVEYHAVLFERSFPPKSVSCTDVTCCPKSSHGTLVSLLECAPLKPENTDTALDSAKLPTSFPRHQPKQILLQDLCRIPQIALPYSKTTFTPPYESITDEVQTKDVTFASPAVFDNVKQEGAAVTSSTDCKGQGKSRQGDGIGGFSVPSKKFDKNNNDVCLTDNANYGEADTSSLHKAKVPRRSAVLDTDTNISEVGISEIGSTPTEVDRSLSDRKQPVSASTETSSCGSDASMTSDTSSDESPPDSGLRDHPEAITITTPRLERSRKGSNPKRGAVRADPKFRGATVLIQTEIKDGCSQLQMSAFYSNVHPGLLRRHVDKSHGGFATPYSQSETDDHLPVPTRDVKICASCKTRRTPLWRDSEDGTPLCNACGIRYKKYRLRCSRCWHIPKKDVKTYPHCPVCAALLGYSFHKKTHTW